MAPRPPTVGDWLSLFGLTACWGTAFLFNELALAAFDTEMIIATRIALGAIVLVVYARYTGAKLPAPFAAWRAWIPMFVTAVFGVIVPFFLTLWAQIHLESATTAVLMAVMPLMVMTMAHFFVPGERLSGPKLVGFAVGFAGIVLVMGPQPAAPGGSLELVAMLAVLGAALSYSGTSVYARLNSTASPAAMAAGMLLVATVFTAPLLTGIDSQEIVIPGSAIATTTVITGLFAIAVLGIFATGLASVLYFRVVAGPGPSFLALVNYMVPAWGVLLGVGLLGESLSSLALIGLLLILAGIAMSEFGHRRWRRKPQTRNPEQSRLSSV